MLLEHGVAKNRELANRVSIRLSFIVSYLHLIRLVLEFFLFLSVLLLNLKCIIFYIVKNQQKLFEEFKYKSFFLITRAI